MRFAVLLYVVRFYMLTTQYLTAFTAASYPSLAHTPTWFTHYLGSHTNLAHTLSWLTHFLAHMLTWLTHYLGSHTCTRNLGCHGSSIVKDQQVQLLFYVQFQLERCATHASAEVSYLQSCTYLAHHEPENVQLIHIYCYGRHALSHSVLLAGCDQRGSVQLGQEQIQCQSTGCLGNHKPCLQKQS